MHPISVATAPETTRYTGERPQFPSPDGLPDRLAAPPTSGAVRTAKRSTPTAQSPAAAGPAYTVPTRTAATPPVDDPSMPIYAMPTPRGPSQPTAIQPAASAPSPFDLIAELPARTNAMQLVDFDPIFGQPQPPPGRTATAAASGPAQAYHGANGAVPSTTVPLVATWLPVAPGQPAPPLAAAAMNPFAPMMPDNAGAAGASAWPTANPALGRPASFPAAPFAQPVAPAPARAPQPTPADPFGPLPPAAAQMPPQRASSQPGADPFSDLLAWTK